MWLEIVSAMVLLLLVSTGAEGLWTKCSLVHRVVHDMFSWLSPQSNKSIKWAEKSKRRLGGQILIGHYSWPNGYLAVLSEENHIALVALIALVTS